MYLTRKLFKAEHAGIMYQCWGPRISLIYRQIGVWLKPSSSASYWVREGLSSAASRGL